MRVACAALAMLLLLVPIAGCGDKAEDGNGGSPSIGAVAEPGLYEQADGTTQALGLLTYRNLEGGFWAVVDTAVPADADTAEIVAVIAPGSDFESKMESYRDQYVSVIGTLDDGPNIYQAGPVIEAASIDVVEEMVVE